MATIKSSGTGASKVGFVKFGAAEEVTVLADDPKFMLVYGKTVSFGDEKPDPSDDGWTTLRSVVGRKTRAVPGDGHGKGVSIEDFREKGPFQVVTTIAFGSPAERRATLSALETVLNLKRIVSEQGRDEETFQSLLETSARLVENRPEHGSALTNDRAEYLVASGAYTQEQLDEAEAAIASGELAAMEQESELSEVTESYSTGEAADLLGVDDSRVRGRQSKGLLYSFTVGRNRRYPSWQFVDSDSKLVPHLAALVEFFNAHELHHATVEGFMTTTQDELALETLGDAVERPMTPVEWLVAGNDPQEVFELFESYLAA